MAVARQEKVLRDNIETLGTGDKQARTAALHALGRLDDPRAIPALLATLKSADADLRALAMGKLVFLNNKSVVPALLKALDDPEQRVRQHALYALERMKVRAAANRIAQVLLRDQDKVTRLNAAQALAAVGSRKQAAAFIKALDDPYAHTLVTAFRALAVVAPDKVCAQVLRLVRNTKRWQSIWPGYQDVILRLLRGSLKQKEVIAFLRKMVDDGLRKAKQEGRQTFTMDVTEAASLLAEVGDPYGVPVLLGSLRGYEYTQERALIHLARLKASTAVPLIMQTALQNGFYTVKIHAVRALGEIGDVRALPALASIFNGRTDDFPVEVSVAFAKDDPDLRLSALAAMAKIATQNLREATASPDAFEQKLARGLLTTIQKTK
jgi:HEAT repeat protein